MLDFYTIEHTENKGTPYAPTIVSNNKVSLDACHECGRSQFNHDNRHLKLVIEGKKKLPDFLLCGHYPLKIISRRVLDAL